MTTAVVADFAEPVNLWHKFHGETTTVLFFFEGNGSWSAAAGPQTLVCRPGAPNGKHYYPDFIVKAAGRDRGDGLLLVEVKGEHLLNSMNTPDKAVVSHELYRKPLMVARESSGRWMMTLCFNERTAQVEFDAVFRIESLPEY